MWGFVVQSASRGSQAGTQGFVDIAKECLGVRAVVWGGREEVTNSFAGEVAFGAGAIMGARLWRNWDGGLEAPSASLSAMLLPLASGPSI